MEHEAFEPDIVSGCGESAVVRLNAGNGLRKQFVLNADAASLSVEYSLPPGVPHLSTEFGLSPDYLELLRCGSACLEPVGNGHVRGFRNGAVAVCVRLHGAQWEQPYQKRFGHGCMLRAGSGSGSFCIEVAV
jgi:hypothetical protein